MDKGIYTATSGGLVESRRLQNAANNIANANTVGFKSQRMVNRQQEFEDALASEVYTTGGDAEKLFELTPGVVTEGSQTDFSAGPVSYTDNPLDVAVIEKDVFFVVGAPRGEEFTRAGSFLLDSQRRLVTPEGYPVQGTSGDITLPQGQVQITEDGAVMVDNQEVSRLRTVKIEDTSQLEHRGGTRFAFLENVGGNGQDVEARVIPRSVEMTNLSVVEGMVELVSVQRSFEAYQKMVRTIDELNERAMRLTRA